MLHLQGRIRDYNASTDTCSIELDGIGMIETWLDGVAIDPAMNRAYCYHGNRVAVAVQDPHRLDEAIVVGLADKPTTPQHYDSSGKVTTQVGRGYIATDGTGAGSTTVTYPSSYTTSPDVVVNFDNNVTFTISANSGTGFTVSVTGLTAYKNTYIYFTWHAYGT